MDSISYRKRGKCTAENYKQYCECKDSIVFGVHPCTFRTKDGSCESALTAEKGIFIPGKSNTETNATRETMEKELSE